MRLLIGTLLLALLHVAAPVAAGEPRTLQWMDLLPADDREAMLRLPETMAELNRKLLAQGVDQLTEDVKLPDVLTSTAIREELAGEYVRVPGFLVPLQLNEHGEATRFFLVPYFGACIHLPPPPPNQMVHITFSDGISADAIYEPYWVTGRMEIETTENELGIATYAMEAQDITLYDG